MKIYYVYIAYGKDDEILYIGKGKNDRYKHCLNGTSQNQSLNRYYFNNGEDGSIRVEKYQEGLTEKEALRLERKLIEAERPPYNTLKREVSSALTLATILIPKMKYVCRTSNVNYKLAEKLFQEFKLFASTFKLYHETWVRTTTDDVIAKCGFCPVGVSKRHTGSKSVKLFNTIFETKLQDRVVYTRFKPEFIAYVKEGK